MLLYTNTANTASSAKINVYQGVAQWDVRGPWSAGLDYTFTQGNDGLDNRRTPQLSVVVQHHLPKRIFLSAEEVCQHASGDDPGTQAWIDELNTPGSAAPSGNQVLALWHVKTI